MYCIYMYTYICTSTCSILSNACSHNIVAEHAGLKAMAEKQPSWISVHVSPFDQVNGQQLHDHTKHY